MLKRKQKKTSSRREQILAIARRNQNLRDGELELDDNAKVSEGDDNGAYIQTWMWVPFDGTPLDKEPSTDD
jgi:hypothetical protein